MRIEVVDRIGPADRDALLDLWVAAWTPAMPAIDFVARRAWFGPYLDGLIEAGAAVLLGRSEDGMPAAFATLDRGTGDIDQLAVHPAYAGRGLATALMAEAKRRSPAGLTLSVNCANEPAVRLYRRAGFLVSREGTSPSSGLPVWFMAWRPADA